MGAGGGCAPSHAKRGSFFTGGRYLMHEKVFSLGQVHALIVSDFSLCSFCLLSVKDVEVQVLIGLFQVQLGK